MTIDSRAYSQQQLIPPSPLPYVSRKALKRVKDAVPLIRKCRYCEGSICIANNSAIYGREFGDWPYLYWCPMCDAYVGMHRDTDIPLGTLADAPLREARKQNKAKFIQMSKVHGFSRTKAYKLLASRMGIPVAECHWGWFEKEQCEQAGRICEEITLKA